jgi:hypothetical protein
MKANSTLFFLLFFSLILSSCDDGDDKKGFGSPCDESTVCEGVCNLGMPQGMCVTSCSESEPCNQGSCVDFGENSYCIPTCETNDQCRESYSCVDFKCVPLQPIGAMCDDNIDCLDCSLQTEFCPQDTDIQCKEEVCSIPCSDQNQCPEGTVCAESGGDYWCISIYFQQGDGTAGANCSVEECANDFTCISDLMGNSTLPFCSNQCTTQRDCPPQMDCRKYNNSTESWCLPRQFCEMCDIDSQCGYDQDKCVSDLNGSTYCTIECDPLMEGTCPIDSTCSEAFLCDDGNWVSDCNNCSGSCISAQSPTSQCFKDYGSCVGTGESCSPCQLDDQCTTSGGCIEVPESKITICADNCDTDGFCPDGYECTTIDGKGDVCLPRSTSCSAPSGEKEMCEPCQEFSDCYTGGCSPLPESADTTKFCLDFCINTSNCGNNATCETLEIDTESFDICVPDATAVDCNGYISAN